MHFQNGSLLFILSAAGVFAALLLIVIFGVRRRERRLNLFAGSAMRGNVAVDIAPRKRRLKNWLFICGIFFLLVAAARPWWGKSLEPNPEQSRDILMAVDVSKSMLATDTSPSRLKHAKWLARQLISNMPADRFGLIVFAGDAYLECPLTRDRNTLLTFLEDIAVGTMPLGGTNIAAALQVTQDALNNGGGANQALVLVTDGGELQGDALDSLEPVQKSEIPLITVGVGDPQNAVPIQLSDGKYLRDKNGELVSTRLNEKILRELARKTNGVYVHSTVASPGMEAIVERLSAVIPEQSENGKTMRPIERYQIPLALGVLLLVTRLFIGERNKRRRILPGKAVLLTMLVFMVWDSPSPGQSTPFTPSKKGPAAVDSSDTEADDSKLRPALELGAEESPAGKEEHGTDTGGVSDEQEKKLRERLQQLEKKAGEAEGGQRARAYYNQGIIWQRLGSQDEAREAYNKTLDHSEANSFEYTLASWNLGILKHIEARRELAESPEKSIQALKNAIDYYREALRNRSLLDRMTGSLTEKLAVNLELAAQDKDLAKGLKQFREAYRKLLKKARQEVLKAISEQEKAQASHVEVEQDRQTKAAQVHTEATDDTISQLEQLIDSVPSSLREKTKMAEQLGRISKAGEATARALQDQEKSRWNLWKKKKKENLLAGALQNLNLAAKLLGARESPQQQQPKNGKQGQKGESRQKQSDRQQDSKQGRQDEGQDKSQAGASQNGSPPKNLDGLEQNPSEMGRQETPKSLDEDQARALLLKMMEREKNFRDALKKYRSRQQNSDTVEKDW
ncbi:MAG: VWA domain-containing protein [Lentisphaeria bacterium]